MEAPAMPGVSWGKSFYAVFVVIGPDFWYTLFRSGRHLAGSREHFEVIALTLVQEAMTIMEKMPKRNQQAVLEF